MSANNNNNNTAGKVKLEFDEDPFVDYRYDYPLDMVPEKNNPGKSPSSDPFDDPFGEMDDPFAGGIKLEEHLPKSKSGMDFGGNKSEVDFGGKKLMAADKLTVDFGGKKSVKKPSPAASEDDQLVWAATESLRLEEERKNVAAQEQADLEYALAISRAEVQNKW